MTLRRTLGLTLVVSLASVSLVAAPTAVEYQGILIGSKLRTTPVKFDHKVGLAGGGALAPGLYDVEVASTGDRSRVLLLFFQNGRKMGEAPGALKLGPGAPGGIIPCVKPGAIVPCVKPGALEPCVKNRGAIEPCIKSRGAAEPCWKPGAIVPCIKPSGKTVQASGKRYLSFEQLGFAGGARANLGAGAGGGTHLTIPGAGGASIDADLPAAR